MSYNCGSDRKDSAFQVFCDTFNRKTDNWCTPGVNFIFGMVYPKARGKTAHSTCYRAGASGSQVTSSLTLLNIGNFYLPWVHVLGSTSKEHANAEMMEGGGFLQKYSLCTQNSLTGVDGVEMTVLQTCDGRNFWMQKEKDTSMETGAELIPQLQRHPIHKHWSLLQASLWISARNPLNAVTGPLKLV